MRDDLTVDDLTRVAAYLDSLDEAQPVLTIHPDSELGREVYAGWSESERRAIRRWMNEQRSKLARGE